MTKADIVQAVYTKLGGFSKKEAADLVDQVFDSMKETLGRGEKIKISGFGNFVLRDKRQRQGRNPQTGEPIVITARRVLNFKASQLLKQALNEGLSDEEWSDTPGRGQASSPDGNAQGSGPQGSGPQGSGPQSNGAPNGQASGGDATRLRAGVDSAPSGSDRGGRG
jgi:integration host factor subunit alpha